MKKLKMARKPKKPKPILVWLIPATTDGKPTPEYALMRALIDAHHDHLNTAKIALAWRLGWKADRDGRIKLGQTRKTSDLDRELREFDFVILLNRPFWDTFDEPKRRALIDHQLHHCQVVLAEDGRVKIDEKGRKVYRLRGHDVEEFRAVIERHGLWKADLEEFAKACAAASRPTLWDKEPGKNGKHPRRSKSKAAAEVADGGKA